MGRAETPFIEVDIVDLPDAARALIGAPVPAGGLHAARSRATTSVAVRFGGPVAGLLAAAGAAHARSRWASGDLAGVGAGIALIAVAVAVFWRIWRAREAARASRAVTGVWVVPTGVLAVWADDRATWVPRAVFRGVGVVRRRDGSGAMHVELRWGEGEDEGRVVLPDTELAPSQLTSAVLSRLGGAALG
jgi:hypothetical protein